MEMLLFKTIVVVSALAVAVAIRYIVPSLKDDNSVEEVMEDVIKKEIGVDIDITPNSPEKEE